MRGRSITRTEGLGLSPFGGGVPGRRGTQQDRGHDAVPAPAFAMPLIPVWVLPKVSSLGDGTLLHREKLACLAPWLSSYQNAGGESPTHHPGLSEQQRMGLKRSGV